MRLPNPPPQLGAPVAPAEGPRDTRLQPRTQSCGPGPPAQLRRGAGGGSWLVRAGHRLVQDEVPTREKSGWAGLDLHSGQRELQRVWETACATLGGARISPGRIALFPLA